MVNNGHTISIRMIIINDVYCCDSILVSGPAIFLTLKLLRDPMFHKPDYLHYINLTFSLHSYIIPSCFTRGLVNNLIPGRTF